MSRNIKIIVFILYLVIQYYPVKWDTQGGETSQLAGVLLTRTQDKWDFSLKCPTYRGFWEETTTESSYSFAEKCVGFLTKYDYVCKYIILYCDDATLK